MPNLRRFFASSERRTLAWLGCVVLVLSMALYVWLAPLDTESDTDRELRRLSDLADLKLRLSRWPDVMVMPPADTPVRISTPFGRFTIPLANIASRNLFTNTPQARASYRPQLDESYVWESPSIVFWMPDGAGVSTDPSHLLQHTDIEPTTLIVRRSPLRPREHDRPAPSQDRFVVVAGRFCRYDQAPARPAARSSYLLGFDGGQGSNLLLTGYGWGALNLWSCADEAPPAPWIATSVPNSDRSVMFCRDDAGHCFGWVPLDRWRVRSLVYVPRDALEQMPTVAYRLQVLLESWQDQD